MTMEEQFGVTECVAYLTAAARMTVAKKSVVHSAATSWSGRAGERASEASVSYRRIQFGELLPCPQGGRTSRERGAPAIDVRAPVACLALTDRTAATAVEVAAAGGGTRSAVCGYTSHGQAPPQTLNLNVASALCPTLNFTSTREGDYNARARRACGR